MDFTEENGIGCGAFRTLPKITMSWKMTDWSPLSRNRKQSTWPIVFEEDLEFTEQFVEKTKSLKLIIPHLGMLGGSPLDFLAAFKKAENIYFDTSLGNPSTILKFVQTIGPERVLFGSDIPFGTMKQEVNKVLGLNIPDAQKEFILADNVKRLTGIE